MLLLPMPLLVLLEVAVRSHGQLWKSESVGGRQPTAQRNGAEQPPQLSFSGAGGQKEVLF